MLFRSQTLISWIYARTVKQLVRYRDVLWQLLPISDSFFLLFQLFYFELGISVPDPEDATLNPKVLD